MSKVIKIHEEKKHSPVLPMPKTILGLYELEWREYLKRKNYNKDINQMCTNCQKDQLKRFGKITIECNGPRKVTEHVPDDILDELSDDERAIVASLYDPYMYADMNLDSVKERNEKRFFTKRWYQEQLVTCSAKRKAIRCGRRVGKSFSLALDIWFRMTTIPGYKVLIVTPFLTQAKELSDLVRKMLRKSHPRVGSWEELVENSRITPVHEVVLKNGSVMKAFTAGGGDAGSVRGQGADLIILDEADFLTQESFNSIIAIMADNQDVELICTSTPMGENILFKLSNSPEYKEFHFPTFVLPHYSDKLDEDFRNGTDVGGYIQEIQAEFSLDSSVVFQPEFIDKCSDKKEPDAREFLQNRDKYILALGCDWNGDKVGTRICIIALDKSNGEIYIAKLDNVIKEGWTQVAAIQKIIDLNRIYNLDHIYVDEGFGESNVQQLKLHAYNNYGKLPKDHPDLKLDQVVAVSFGSTLELRDVITGEVRKKHYKNFIVDTVTRALENNILNLAGRTADPIKEQMRNYIVKSVSSSGRKVYQAKVSEIGDHDLDAYMIAVTALHLEHDSILDKRVMSDVQVLTLEKTNTRGYNESSSITERISPEDLLRSSSGLFHTYKSSAPSRSRTDGFTSSRYHSMGSALQYMNRTRRR